MKKIYIIFLLPALLMAYNASAQKPIGTAQKKMLDSLCNCLTKLDYSTINSKEAANTAFMNCFTAHADQMVDVAEEEGIELTDEAGGTALGEMIGKNLLSQKCGSFMKLAVLMGDDDSDEVPLQQSTGIFKRIDNKGFNYIVITENGSEKSFLWLEQFPDSEKFINPATLPKGKKLKVSWLEIEVYLPEAKGYYKVKEIKGVEVL